MKVFEEPGPAAPTPERTRATPDEQFAQFVAARWPALYRTAYMLTGERAEAEDLVQSALVKTFAARGRIRRIEAVEGYVRRTMVTTHTSRWRRVRGREIVTEHPPEGVHAAASAELDGVLARTTLWPHLTRLPAGQRTVIVLRYYEDLTEAQAAHLMGCSVGTVKSQTSRALAALRAALAESGPPVHRPDDGHRTETSIR
ncbi:MAG: SigE family RNA polymerase sigma factor [Nocardioides sp.]